jgi:solute carrier family 25 carnitine/acylcarnitine transporter 20/29
LNKKEKKWYSPFVAGSFSGFIVGFLNYPFDVIKAKIQSDTLSNPKYKGIMDCIRKTTKAEGVNGLYKGLATNVARAVPCNAIYFGLFHYTM